MEGATMSKIHPLFGAKITGTSLVSLLSESLESALQNTETRRRISKLKELIHEYKVVLFRDQGILTGEQQIQISQWFGNIEDAGFEQHPKSPHRLILRVSNDETEGFQEFGTSGFHIDGSFMEKPNDFSIYHMIEKPARGSTAFVDLNLVFCELPDEQKLHWQRLWLLKTYKRIRGHTDMPGYVIHPLVYNHPVTGLKTLCIHQGKTSRFLKDWGVNIARKETKQDTTTILEDIEKALKDDHGKFQYCHQWEAGDLIVSDNLAVAHVALPDTQLPTSEVGLRVMHRTVIRGTHRPWTDAKQCLVQYVGGENIENIDLDDIDNEDIRVIKDYSFGNMDKMMKLSKALRQF